MPAHSLSLPSLPAFAVPAALKDSSRKVSLSSRKTFFHGRRFIANQAWNAFYSLMVTVIPDDAYDWEDEAYADFFGDDLSDTHSTL